MKKIDKHIDFKSPSMVLLSLILEYFLCVLVFFTFAKVVKLKNCFGIVQTLSFAVPLAIQFIFSNTKFKKVFHLLTVILLYCFIILVLPFLFGRTYDITIDGNSYHKTAIAFLKNGWNPLYETSENFQKDNDNIIPFEEKTRISLWINHYPKASWIIAANYYAYTNNIESGKCLSFILMICVAILSYNVIGIFLKKRWAFILAILMSLNPIAIGQVFMYYVDGIMGSCFIMELLLLFLYKPEEKTNVSLVILLTAVCSIFINLKFTGLVYSGLIAALFYFYWLFKYRKNKEFKEIALRLTRNFVIIFATSIFVVGSSSYITNTVNKHNPLYPLIGPDKVDIITEMQPKSFGEINNFEKFIWSMFSETENVTYITDHDPKLKLPFIVKRSEIDALSIPDARIAGFGPLFALGLCMAVISLIISTIKIVKNEQDKLFYIIISLFSVIISMILVGESWWARYIPQLYYSIVGSLILFIYTFKYYKFKKVMIAFNALLLTVVLINTSFFVYNNLRSLNEFKDIRNDLYELKTMTDLELTATDPTLYGYYYNLRDYGIKYKLIDDISVIDEENIRYKYCWKLQIVNKKE